MNIPAKALTAAIERVIESPPDGYTPEDVQALLRAYGVLDANNKVTKEFKKIFKEPKNKKAASAE